VYVNVTAVDAPQSNVFGQSFVVVARNAKVLSALRTFAPEEPVVVQRNTDVERHGTCTIAT